MDDLVKSFTDAVEEFVAFPGESQADRLGQELRNLIAFITELQESRTKVQDLALQNAEDLKKTMADKTAIEAEYKTLIPELVATQETLKEAQRRNRNLTSRLSIFDAVQQENEELQRMVEELEAQIQALNFRYNRMTNSWKQKKIDIEEKAKERKDKAIAKLKEEFEREFAAQNVDINELKEQLVEQTP